MAGLVCRLPRLRCVAASLTTLAVFALGDGDAPTAATALILTMPPLAAAPVMPPPPAHRSRRRAADPATPLLVSRDASLRVVTWNVEASSLRRLVFA